MQNSRTWHGRRPRCSNHQWSTPMVVAGMRRRICERCGEITLELTSESFSVPESLRIPEHAS